jgi:hypothetical protein
VIEDVAVIVAIFREFLDVPSPSLKAEMPYQSSRVRYWLSLGRSTALTVRADRAAKVKRENFMVMEIV